MFVFKGEQLFAYFGGHDQKCTILDHARQAECAAPGNKSDRRSIFYPRDALVLGTAAAELTGDGGLGLRSDGGDH